jgi:thymidylate kinase
MIGVIIEGITGSGKTRLVGHLQRVLATRAPANTKLFIGEHYTERALEHLQEAGTLVPPTVIAHLHGLFGLLDPLRAAKQRSRFRDHAGNTTVLVIMERFLLGRIAIMRIHDPETWKLTPELVASITELYRRADECGLRRVILRVTPEAIRERVLSTRHHRNAAWCEHLAAQGDDDAIVQRYVREQNLLLEPSEALRSVVEPVYVDVDAVWEDAEYATVAEDLVHRLFAR